MTFPVSSDCSETQQGVLASRTIILKGEPSLKVLGQQF